MRISKKIRIEIESAAMFMVFAAYGLWPFYIAVTVGLQCLYWLIEGLWFPVSTADALDFVGLNVTGFYTADRMLGFFKILQLFVELPSVIGVPLILIAATHLIRWAVLTLLSLFEGA